MEWILIAAIAAILVIVRNLDVITIKFKDREQPKVEKTVTRKSLKD